MRRVASRTSTTQGTPSSRATTAPWESRPPTSATTRRGGGEHRAQRGVEHGRHEHLARLEPLRGAGLEHARAAGADARG